MEKLARVPKTDEEWEEYRRVHAKATSDRYRALSEETKNPIYAWKAILEFLAYEEPLPDWCIEYIKCCAMEMHNLVLKLVGDVHRNGAPKELPPTTSDINAVTNAIPAALQLRRRGWNAFRQYAADLRSMQDATSAAMSPWLKISNAETVKFIAQRRRFSETSEKRLVARQVKKGQKLLAVKPRTKPTP